MNIEDKSFNIGPYGKLNKIFFSGFNQKLNPNSKGMTILCFDLKSKMATTEQI